MAARKAGRKKKRNKKVKRHRAKSAETKLMERVKESGLLTGKEIIYGRHDEVKMSEVILDFADPLFERFGTDVDDRIIIGIAMTAWNISLFPVWKHRGLINEMINELSPPDKEIADDMKKLLKDLIRRKRKHFSEHKRLILDYETSRSKNRLSLTVISSIEP